MIAQPVARPRQAGGATLTVVAVVVLRTLAYLGYRAYGFYRENVAPVVADVSNLASTVASLARSLDPFKVTKRPDGVAQPLRTSFGIAPPDGYVVLKPFDLPAGLAGAAAPTFILPVGALRPGGPQGHGTFLPMENFQCYGVGCN